MDFKKIFIFYIDNYNSLRCSWVLNSLLFESYRLLQYRRGKLKTGVVKFVEKKFYYGNLCLFSWFEMQYSSQPAQRSELSEMDKISKLLDFS